MERNVSHNFLTDFIIGVIGKLFLKVKFIKDSGVGLQGECIEARKKWLLEVREVRMRIYVSST